MKAEKNLKNFTLDVFNVTELTNQERKNTLGGNLESRASIDNLVTIACLVLGAFIAFNLPYRASAMAKTSFALAGGLWFAAEGHKKIAPTISDLIEDRHPYF